MNETVQNWITRNWGRGSHNPKCDYQNCEALLERLHRIEKRSRFKIWRPWQFLNSAYEQVQLMRKIALGKEEI